jgi:hypothetical protein
MIHRISLETIDYDHFQLVAMNSRYMNYDHDVVFNLLTRYCPDDSYFQQNALRFSGVLALAIYSSVVRLWDWCMSSDGERRQMHTLVFLQRKTRALSWNLLVTDQKLYHVLHVSVYWRRADALLLSMIPSSSAYIRLNLYDEQCWYSTASCPRRESLVFAIIHELTFYSLHICLSFNSQMYMWRHHVLRHVFCCFRYIIWPVAFSSS